MEPRTRFPRPRRAAPAAAWAWACAALAFAALLPAARAGQATADPVPAGTGTPAGVFQAACAACHGVDGRGAPRHQRGFEIDPPDFTDCSFATREADSDWFAVVHEGGPVRAFDRRMPSFGAALGPDRIRQALAHVRTFCPEEGWPPGNLNRPRPMFTEKAFVEDEAVLTLGASLQAPLAFEAEAIFEKRLGRRSQFELVVPAGAVERPGEGTRAWGGGLGDIALGLSTSWW